jgi:hypothetical protein
MLLDCLRSLFISLRYVDLNISVQIYVNIFFVKVNYAHILIAICHCSGNI